MSEQRVDAPTEQILGICFFNGTTQEAVARMCAHGGLLVVPAAPALVNVQYDPGYREALVRSDMAIADSGVMVLLWRRLKQRSVSRISGLAYLKALLDRRELRQHGALLVVVPTDAAKEKALAYFRANAFAIADEHCYVAPYYERSEIHDERLLQLVGTIQPRHIVIGLGGGVQEKLGLYLRDHLSYRPAIHCIGAALGFVTGDQLPIPDWADKLYLGWLLRLARNPLRFFRRFAVARELPGLIAKYGSALPPLRIKR